MTISSDDELFKKPNKRPKKIQPKCRLLIAQYQHIQQKYASKMVEEWLKVVADFDSSRNRSIRKKLNKIIESEVKKRSVGPGELSLNKK